ncbi:pyocin knob domain-containing protein [Phocaeicola plebeius]|uniref:pyocin knob domain-containing protein n=2 Tax=Phocaeicola plebeius TaxID=310297 RepID=UPI0026F0CA29|nr:pyocin knob domain-containing protein [Phocaeicola plebeius]
MAAEEDFVLSFTGEETDNLLKHTESMKNQTTADDGETVQVYDTNGVPHKVSKTELLKKSTLALPKLEDISSFVAINAAGNAVGLMTKEQVASVLAGLIDFPFKYRSRVDINTDANSLTESGFYAVYCYREDISSKHYPIQLGHIIVFRDGAGGSVSQLAISDKGTSYTRMRWGLDNWSEWIQLS